MIVHDLICNGDATIWYPITLIMAIWGTLSLLYILIKWIGSWRC